nr:hypothetical protein [uncultured Ruminococcus sp.]
MKTKLSRVGKSSLSMILSLMMIFSTMLIGTITTANAAINYWTVTAGFNSWNTDDPNYRIDGSTGSVTYDTNSSRNIIYFRMVAHEGEKVIQNSLKNGETVSISSDSRQKLVWGISDTSKSISFTPTKRYVKFSIDSDGENNYLTVTESDSASGGGATIGPAPANVLNRTNVMFYVKAYSGGDGNVALTDGNVSNVIYATLYEDSGGYAYVSVPNSKVKSYKYISNNVSGKDGPPWAGKPNDNISDYAKGGQLFYGDNSQNYVTATTANTTLSSDTIVKPSANSVTLTTTASSDKAAYDKMNLYIQYYVDDVLVVTGNDIKASTSAQTYTLDVSAYKDGNYTLKTVLTDGKVYYIADTDTFTINSVEQTQLATPEIEVSNGGVITSSGNVTVSVKNKSTYPADAGVTFELYKDGTNTSKSNKTGSFEVNEPGSYTVKAVSNNDNYIESDLSSPVTVAAQETSAFQLCEGSSFTSLGSFTKLGDKYSITFNFTKGTHKLSVYNTVEKKHYLNENAGTLAVVGNESTLYKYYDNPDNTHLADFIAERDGDYTFEFTKNASAGDNAWNLTLVKVPDAVKYKVTPNIKDVANLASMTITDSSDVANTEFAADSVVKVTLTASGDTYKPGGLKLTKNDGSEASVNVSSNGNGVFSFNMPEYDVTVTPVITPKAYYDVTLNYDSKIGNVTSTHEIADNKIANVMEGTIVDLTATGKDDYNFVGWGISGATVTEGTVNAPTIKIRVDSTTIVKAMFADNAFTVVNDKGKVLSAMSKVEENVYVSSTPVADKVTFTVKGSDNKYIKSTADNNSSFWLTKDNYSNAYSSNVKSFEDNIVNPYYNNSGSSRYVVYDANKKSVYLVDDPSLRLTYSVYAKNGTIAKNGTQNYGVTKVTSGVIDTAGLQNDGYTKYMAVEGSIITVQTTVNEAYKNAGYYVYAYCVNGKTVTAQQTKPGVYSASYTIDGTNTDIEITPVYFNTNIEKEGDYITFYVNADELKGKWGDTVALYTYYYKSDVVDNDNAFNASAYPGQPMLQNKDGLFYIKVPKYYYANGVKQFGYGGDDKKPYSVSGMTINNYGLESLHKNLKGAKDANGKVANRQSYDYKDFAVLAEQGYDTIMFDVKYRTGTSNQSSLLDNAKNAPDKTGTKIDISAYGKTHNDWDYFINYFSGNKTDVLGYDLDTTQTQKLYVVSTGNQQTTVGVWSTEWYVFDQDGKFIVQGNPNDFILTDEDVAQDSTNKIWNALKDYKGAETKICYESEMTAATSNSSGNDGIRVDGRWYYTKADDVKVTLNTKVQYSQDHGTTFRDDTNTNTENTGFVGQVTGVKAAINDATSYEFPLNATDAVLTASSSSLWLFKGWYVKDADGNYIEYDKDAMSEIELVTGAYTEFVARYIEIGSGQLVLSHTAYDGPDKLGGRGTYYMQVEHTDKDNNTTTYTYTTGSITIPIVQSDKSISITLKTVCAGNNTFYSFYDKDKDDKYEPFVDEDGELVGKTGIIKYSFTVNPSDLFDLSGKQVTKALNYYSDISPVTGDAVLNYRYKNRFDQDRVYTVKVKLDDNYYDTAKNAYIIDPNNHDHQKLIMDNAPAIDDLHKDCLWSIAQQTTTINGTNVVLDGIQTGKEFNVELSYCTDKAANETDFAPVYSGQHALNSYIKNSDTGDFYKTAAEVNGKKFLYWSVVSDNTKREIARCYSQYFNLRVTDNFIVTPIYGDTSESYISIGNATYTREQYTEAGINYDYLYADFIVAFMSPDAELLNQSSKYKTGVIVELNQNAKVTETDVIGGTFGAVGSTVNYSGIKFNSSSDEIKNLATGNSSSLNYTNVDGVRNIAYKFEINNQGYNNKNRLDYYVKFKNTQAYRNYVMKAYYYVYKVDESGKAVPDTFKIAGAVYFNLYDIGNSKTNK